MKRFGLIFALLICSSLAWATTITANTSVTKNLSDTTAWVGGVAPRCTGLDNIIIPSSSTITVDSGAALASTLTLTQVAVSLPNVTYSYSSYTGTIPVPGTTLTFSSFTNAGNNITAPLSTISGGASGTLTIYYPPSLMVQNIYPIAETHAGSATGSYCILGTSGASTVGSVQSVANPSGSSFSGTCSVAFSGGGGGIGAAATCAISSGSIITTLTQGGDFYNSAPTATYTCTGCSSTTSPSVVINNGGTAAVSAAGVVKVATGVSLIARGDVLNNLTAGTVGWLVLNAGSAFAFDSSQATTPTITRYIAGMPVWGSVRWIDTTACTAAQPCVFTSVTANGALPGVTACYGNTSGCTGGGLEAAYTAFSFLGDATVAATSVTGNNSVPWQVIHSSWDNCGVVGLGAYGVLPGTNLQSNQLFQHNYNVHTHSLAIYSPIFTSSTVALGTAARELIGDTFDTAVGGFDGNGQQLEGFTTTGSYFGGGLIPSHLWATLSNNFWRMLPNQEFNLPQSISSSYVYFDVDSQTNPHYFGDTPGAAGNFTLNKIIVGTSATTTGDSGEWLVGPAVAGSSWSFTNSLQMCNPSGVGASELASTEGTTTGTWTFGHNTVCGGYPGYGAVQLNEANLTPAGVVTFQDNLIFSLAPAAWYKMESENLTSPTADVCVSSAACNYNGSYNLTPKTMSTCTGCTNQAKSYSSKWTAQTPGANDVDDQSPNFLATGWASNHFWKVEDFDLLYLGPKGLIPSGQASPSAWSAGTYSLNAFVSHSYSTMYNSETFNFRCIVTSCTLEPGVPGTAWRGQWEWAALYQLRNLTAAQTSITDATIGCGSGCSVIQALNAWTFAGQAPTNAAYATSAHDGTTIGAVAYQAPASTGCAGCVMQMTLP
jgi:hypothetical protein